MKINGTTGTSPIIPAIKNNKPSQLNTNKLNNNISETTNSFINDLANKINNAEITPHQAFDIFVNKIININGMESTESIKTFIATQIHEDPSLRSLLSSLNINLQNELNYENK